MNYKSTLIAVKDINKAKKFYHEILGLDVIEDFGENVTLTGGISLQTLDTWKTFIYKQDNEIIFGNNASELYFEEDDLDSFIKRLDNFNIKLIHPVFEHSWGQRCIRFYDEDGHIIEVGENLNIVIRRYLDSGLSVEETATRMDVSADYIRACVVNIGLRS